MAAFQARLLDAFIDMFEPAVRRLRAKSRLVAVESGEDLAFYRVSKGHSRVVSAGDDRQQAKLRRMARNGVELRLQPDRIIAKTLKLPAGGRDYIEPIIEHRLERLTPWLPEKVLYGFAISPAAPADGLIDVDFAATSRDIAARSIARLDALGLQTTSIGSAGDPIEQTVGVDLMRGRRHLARHRARRTIGRLLTAMLAILFAAFVASAIFESRAERQVAALDAALLRERQALLQLGGDAERQRNAALIDAKRADRATFVLVDRLAAIIPVDTYLTALEIERETIRLVGSSANAPALVPLLEADDGLSGARFAAPISRGDDNRDRFEIAVGRVVEDPAEPADAQAGQ